MAGMDLPDPTALEALLRVLRAQGATGCEISNPDGTRLVLTLSPGLGDSWASGLDVQDLRDLDRGPGGRKR